MLFVDGKMSEHPKRRLPILFSFKLFPADLTFMEFHSTPAQTGHVRLFIRQYLQLSRKRAACLTECMSSGSGQRPGFTCCPDFHSFRSVIDHQLQTVPAPIAAVMSGASPCPVLTVRGDQQEKSIPAHRSSHGPRVLLFESFFPVSQREQNLGGDRQMLTVHRLT